MNSSKNRTRHCKAALILVALSLWSGAFCAWAEIDVSRWVEAVAVPPAQLGEELVKNPGFEQADDAGILAWDGTPFLCSSATEFAFEGQCSVRIASAEAGPNSLLTQNLAPQAKVQKYRLQYRVRAEQINQEYRVYIGIWRGTNWLDGVDTQWRAGLPNWQDVTVDFEFTGARGEADRLMVVLEVKAGATCWFDAVSLKSLAQQEADPAPVSAYVGSPAAVQITSDRYFRVRGEPFFPLLVWGAPTSSEKMYSRAREFGYNAICHVAEYYGPSGARMALNLAEKHGLKVVLFTRVDLGDKQLADLPDRLARIAEVVEAVKDHPALLCYLLSDEPAWGGLSLRAFAASGLMIRDLDPNHPLFVNHAPRNTIDELRRFNQYVDIAGSDIYPVWAGGQPDRHSDLPNKTLGVVGDEVTKNLVALGGHRPVIQTLQAFSWSAAREGTELGAENHPFPTPQELRFMSYDAVLAGAGGLTQFQDHRYRELRPELKPIVGEMSALEGVLAGGRIVPAEKVCAQGGLRVMVREYKGNLVLLAVNRTGQPIEADFDLAGLAPAEAGSAPVLFEDRATAIAASRMQDHFAPWAVHVYVLTGKPEDVLKPVVQAPPVALAPAAVRDCRAELEAKLPKGRRNLALASQGVKASASSEYGSGMVASVVNDGDRWGNQWNDATMNDYPDWVAVEFPKPTTVDTIVICTRQLELFDGWFPQGIRDYEVQVREQDTWRTVKAFIGDQSYAQVVQVEPREVTGIRVWITATNGNGDYSRVMEIEAYGPSARS